MGVKTECPHCGYEPIVSFFIEAGDLEFQPDPGDIIEKIDCRCSECNKQYYHELEEPIEVE